MEDIRARGYRSMDAQHIYWSLHILKGMEVVRLCVNHRPHISDHVKQTVVGQVKYSRFLIDKRMLHSDNGGI